MGISFKKTAKALAVNVSAILLAFIPPSFAMAEENHSSKLSIELNAVQQDGERCRLVFLTTNATGTDIEELSLETVLFDATGTFLRLTLFEFRALPSGKPRVRQFAIPATQCQNLGRVLINGTSSCKVAGEEAGLCEEKLNLTTKATIELLG